MIAAIILAAGEATRFGSCKQLARISGKPLLERVLEAVAESAVDDIVVVLGAHADEIKSAIDFGIARVVINPDFAKGLSTSIRVGLGALRAEAKAAFVVLADQPFVLPATLDRLIDEYRRTRAPIVMPVFQGVRGNPVLVDRSLFTEMMSLDGDVGGRAIFEQHRDEIQKVPVDDRGVVTDIDTAADLAVLE